jgi:hypothetical protein
MAGEFKSERWANKSRNGGRLAPEPAPITLNRKNALFAGSDGGGENWAILASLIETCKLSRVNPQAYLADALTKIVNGHLNSQIDDLLPWAYATQDEPLRAVA